MTLNNNKINFKIKIFNKKIMKINKILIIKINMIYLKKVLNLLIIVVKEFYQNLLQLNDFLYFI